MSSHVIPRGSFSSGIEQRTSPSATVEPQSTKEPAPRGSDNPDSIRPSPPGSKTKVWLAPATEQRAELSEISQLTLPDGAWNVLTERPPVAPTCVAAGGAVARGASCSRRFTSARSRFTRCSCRASVAASARSRSIRISTASASSAASPSEPPQPIAAPAISDTATTRTTSGRDAAFHGPAPSMFPPNREPSPERRDHSEPTIAAKPQSSRRERQSPSHSVRLVRCPIRTMS